MQEIKIIDTLKFDIITLNKRIEFKIELSSNKKNDALQLVLKEDELELTYYVSEQFCQSIFSGIPENYILTFNFNRNYLTTFGNKYLNISKHVEKELCCSSRLIIFEIMKTKLNGALKNMFIESKAIELLLCVIGCETTTEDKCSSCKFLTNPYEKEKIYAARDILLLNLENPPVIPQLANQVCINQCYLKKGFKDIFGTTVYAFVQEQRIIKAKLLLKSSHNSISEIGDIVGFSNPSNFSNAFKNYTGLLPSEFRNN